MITAPRIVRQCHEFSLEHPLRPNRDAELRTQSKGCRQLPRQQPHHVCSLPQRSIGGNEHRECVQREGQENLHIIEQVLLVAKRRRKPFGKAPNRCSGKCLHFRRRARAKRPDLRPPSARDCFRCEEQRHRACELRPMAREGAARAASNTWGFARRIVCPRAPCKAVGL